MGISRSYNFGYGVDLVDFLDSEEFRENFNFQDLDIYEISEEVNSILKPFGCHVEDYGNLMVEEPKFVLIYTKSKIEMSEDDSQNLGCGNLSHVPTVKAAILSSLEKLGYINHQEPIWLVFKTIC